MTEKLRNDLIKALQGFILENYEEVHRDIGNVVGKVLMEHGYDYVALAVSPMDEGRGFKVRMDLKDKTYSMEVAAESVFFDEIDS